MTVGSLEADAGATDSVSLRNDESAARVQAAPGKHKAPTGGTGRGL